MEIKIMNYTDPSDKSELYSILMQLMEKHQLVPVIGSGFTCGIETTKGAVPTANEFRDFLATQIALYKKYKQDDCESLKLMKLSDVAYEFWDMVESENARHYMSSLVNFIDCNFRKVYKLPQYQRRFLNSGWRYIYTLNYDDAIEQNIDINRIYPYDQQNHEFLNSRPCLFKIHGDAEKFVLTGDSRFCILSKKQYINAIKDPNNRDMLRGLESDFYSNSILFVGCGLTDELDLLYSAEIGLSEKSKINIEHKIIYVYYHRSISHQI